MKKLEKAFKAYTEIEDDIKQSVAELIALKKYVLKGSIEKNNINRKIDRIIERLER